MANEIIIRKASKDYVCSCCGHIIRKGDEYLDKVILNVGKVVKHDGYHDECPRLSVEQKLFDRIMRENGDLICSLDGYKVHVLGIMYRKDGPYVMYRDWVNSDVKGVSLRFANKFIDEHGKTIIS